MLAKRVIPCLDVHGGHVTRGVQFGRAEAGELRNVGDPVALAVRYNEQGADEMVFFDITASAEGRRTMTEVIERVAERCFMPLTVGGGIRAVEDMRSLLRAGADKVSINSAALADPELIRAGAEKFGSQCIVVSIDAKRVAPDRWEVFSHGGRKATGLETIEWAARAVHLGAQAGVRYSIENPSAYVQANLVGHCNMLELARTLRLRHLVYASSSSVYGGNKNLPFRVEDRVDHPLSMYAATKKADELLSESYASLYRLPMTGLRFFTVYGPWGRPDMAMWIFTKALFEAKPLTIFNGGDMHRDFTFIDDIVRGVLACVDGPPSDDGKEKAGGSMSPHAVYNIGNHRSEELMRMVGLLEQATGKKAEIDFQPMQAGDVKDTFADISAIQRDHGFEPSTTIDEGVPRFVDWFKRYHRID